MGILYEMSILYKIVFYKMYIFFFFTYISIKSFYKKFCNKNL